MAKEKDTASDFEAPKVGDEVNHVSPGSMKITKAKVAAVSAQHDGRLVTVEIPAKKKNADGDEVDTTSKVTVPYREKAKLAGNTWHFASLLIAGLLALAVPALANIPTYHTMSAAGNTASPATVIFPADPNSQIRIVSVNYTNDSANGVISMASGTTAYTVLQTNLVTSGVTNIITSTNGLAAGAILFLQHAGLVYTNDVTAVGNTGTNTMTINGITWTNAVATQGIYATGPAGVAATNVSWLAIQSGGWGVVQSVGDEIYLVGPVTSISVAIGANWINGEDVFSGNYGRPVLVQLAPCNVTNRIPVVSAHYDSASQ